MLFFFFFIFLDDVKTIGDTVVFRVNLVVDGAEKVIADTVNTITSDLIKGASISVEVNEKVGSAFNKELQARVNLNLKLVAGGGATLLVWFSLSSFFFFLVFAKFFF